MRLKIRPEDVNAHEMSDWIAWLRDEAISETGDGGTMPETVAPDPPAGRSPASAETAADWESTCRAVIGDELRIPIAWCEMGSCISHHTDPAALGEADIRTRALGAGWCLDRLGRLACVDCQQGDPSFPAAHPIALWDREAAVTTVAVMAAYLRDDGADGGTTVAPPAVTPTVEPVISAPAGHGIRGRHRKQP